jgi:hypothetical protein
MAPPASPDSATYLTMALAARGAIVAAPNFPLTSTTAFTRVTAPDISETRPIHDTRQCPFDRHRGEIRADVFQGSHQLLARVPTVQAGE